MEDFATFSLPELEARVATLEEAVLSNEQLMGDYDAERRGLLQERKQLMRQLKKLYKDYRSRENGDTATGSSSLSDDVKAKLGKELKEMLTGAEVFEDKPQQPKASVIAVEQEGGGSYDLLDPRQLLHHTAPHLLPSHRPQILHLNLSRTDLGEKWGFTYDKERFHGGDRVITKLVKDSPSWALKEFIEPGDLIRRVNDSENVKDELASSLFIKVEIVRGTDEGASRGRGGVAEPAAQASNPNVVDRESAAFGSVTGNKTSLQILHQQITSAEETTKSTVGANRDGEDSPVEQVLVGGGGRSEAAEKDENKDNSDHGDHDFANDPTSRVPAAQMTVSKKLFEGFASISAVVGMSADDYSPDKTPTPIATEAVVGFGMFPPETSDETPTGGGDYTEGFAKGPTEHVGSTFSPPKRGGGFEVEVAQEGRGAEADVKQKGELPSAAAGAAPPPPEAAEPEELVPAAEIKRKSKEQEQRELEMKRMAEELPRMRSHGRISPLTVKSRSPNRSSEGLTGLANHVGGTAAGGAGASTSSNALLEDIDLANQSAAGSSSSEGVAAGALPEDMNFPVLNQFTFESEDEGFEAATSSHLPPATSVSHPAAGTANGSLRNSDGSFGSLGSVGSDEVTRKAVATSPYVPQAEGDQAPVSVHGLNASSKDIAPPSKTSSASKDAVLESYRVDFKRSKKKKSFLSYKKNLEQQYYTDAGDDLKMGGGILGGPLPLNAEMPPAPGGKENDRDVDGVPLLREPQIERLSRPLSGFEEKQRMAEKFARLSSTSSGGGRSASSSRGGSFVAAGGGNSSSSTSAASRAGGYSNLGSGSGSGTAGSSGKSHSHSYSISPIDPSADGDLPRFLSAMNRIDEILTNETTKAPDHLLSGSPALGGGVGGFTGGSASLRGSSLGGGTTSPTSFGQLRLGGMGGSSAQNSNPNPFDESTYDYQSSVLARISGGSDKDRDHQLYRGSSLLGSLSHSHSGGQASSASSATGRGDNLLGILGGSFCDGRRMRIATKANSSGPMTLQTRSHDPLALCGRKNNIMASAPSKGFNRSATMAVPGRENRQKDGALTPSRAATLQRSGTSRPASLAGSDVGSELSLGALDSNTPGGGGRKRILDTKSYHMLSGIREKMRYPDGHPKVSMDDEETVDAFRRTVERLEKAKAACEELEAFAKKKIGKKMSYAPSGSMTQMLGSSTTLGSGVGAGNATNLNAMNATSLSSATEKSSSTTLTGAGFRCTVASEFLNNSENDGARRDLDMIAASRSTRSTFSGPFNTYVQQHLQGSAAPSAAGERQPLPVGEETRTGVRRAGSLMSMTVGGAETNFLAEGAAGEQGGAGPTGKPAASMDYLNDRAKYLMLKRRRALLLKKRQQLLAKGHQNASHKYTTPQEVVTAIGLEEASSAFPDETGGRILGLGGSGARSPGSNSNSSRGGSPSQGLGMASPKALAVGESQAAAARALGRDAPGALALALSSMSRELRRLDAGSLRHLLPAFTLNEQVVNATHQAFRRKVDHEFAPSPTVKSGPGVVPPPKPVGPRAPPSEEPPSASNMSSTLPSTFPFSANHQQGQQARLFEKQNAMGSTAIPKTNSNQNEIYADQELPYSRVSKTLASFRSPTGKREFFTGATAAPENILIFPNLRDVALPEMNLPDAALLGKLLKLIARHEGGSPLQSLTLDGNQLDFGNTVDGVDIIQPHGRGLGMLRKKNQQRENDLQTKKIWEDSRKILKDHEKDICEVQGKPWKPWNRHAVRPMPNATYLPPLSDTYSSAVGSSSVHSGSVAPSAMTTVTGGFQGVGAPGGTVGEGGMPPPGAAPAATSAAFGETGFSTGFSGTSSIGNDAASAVSTSFGAAPGSLMQMGFDKELLKRGAILSPIERGGRDEMARLARRNIRVRLGNAAKDPKNEDEGEALEMLTREMDAKPSLLSYYPDLTVSCLDLIKQYNNLTYLSLARCGIDEVAVKRLVLPCLSSTSPPPTTGGVLRPTNTTPLKTLILDGNPLLDMGMLYLIKANPGIFGVLPKPILKIVREYEGSDAGSSVAEESEVDDEEGFSLDDFVAELGGEEFMEMNWAAVGAVEGIKGAKAKEPAAQTAAEERKDGEVQEAEGALVSEAGGAGSEVLAGGADGAEGEEKESRAGWKTSPPSSAATTGKAGNKAAAGSGGAGPKAQPKSRLAPAKSGTKATLNADAGAKSPQNIARPAKTSVPQGLQELSLRGCGFAAGNWLSLLFTDTAPRLTKLDISENKNMFVSYIEASTQRHPSLEELWVEGCSFSLEELKILMRPFVSSLKRVFAARQSDLLEEGEKKRPLPRKVLGFSQAKVKSMRDEMVRIAFRPICLWHPKNVPHAFQGISFRDCRLEAKGFLDLVWNLLPGTTASNSEGGKTYELDVGKNPLLGLSSLSLLLLSLRKAKEAEIQAVKDNELLIAEIQEAIEYEHFMETHDVWLTVWGPAMVLANVPKLAMVRKKFKNLVIRYDGSIVRLDAKGGRKGLTHILAELKSDFGIAVITDVEVF
eukprot:g9962.t1